jgi:hypothetical protein
MCFDTVSNKVFGASERKREKNVGGEESSTWDIIFNPLKPKLVWMLFKNPVRTSKRTPHLTITKIKWLTLFKFNPLKPKLV